MRYLVVIDHTLGGTGLKWAVRSHALEEQDIHVDIIVPAEESESNEAQRRLETELQNLRAEGIGAEGSVVLTEPYEGIRDAVGLHSYDGVIIATHSPAISRWMHLDLPRRVERELQKPVEWIDARSDDPSEHTDINIDLPRAAMRAISESPPSTQP